MNPFSRMFQVGSTATSLTHSYINFSLNSDFHSCRHTPKTMKRLFLSFLLVLVLLLSSSFTEPSMGKSLYCGGKCKERCRRAGVKDRCLKYCNICCAQCKCVPSGTYGNKHQCPCYRDMRNSKGKPKCP